MDELEETVDFSVDITFCLYENCSEPIVGESLEVDVPDFIWIVGTLANFQSGQTIEVRNRSKKDQTNDTFFSLC